jgi:hypothetical protein
MSASTAATKSAQPPNRKLRNILAGLVTVAAWVVIFFTFNPIPPSFDRGPHRALGKVLAQEALKLQQPGGRVFVITRDTVMFKTPAFEAQAEGFRQTLKKARVEIAATRLLKVDPLRVVGVPPSDFLDLLSKANEKDVIVSFMGPPVLDSGQLTKLEPGNRPRVLAVCSGAMPRQIDLKRLFDEKLLHAVVISRGEPATSSGTGEFDRLFKLITPANLAELPPLLSDAR